MTCGQTLTRRCPLAMACLQLLIVDALLYVGSQKHAAKSRRNLFSALIEDASCEPTEGDLVLYRRKHSDQLSLGVVVAEMSCTQWIQPLISKSAMVTDAEQLMLFEEETDAVQVQGDCVAIVDATWGQLPIPSLGGGTGYNSPAVSTWTVKTTDLPVPLEDIFVKVVEGGLAPWCH